MRPHQHTRIGAHRIAHELLQAIGADQVVAVERLGPGEEQRLLDEALDAVELLAERLGLLEQHLARLVGGQALHEVLEHEVRGGQGRLCLVDPGLDVFAIILSLTAILRDVVVGGLRHGTQGLVGKPALRVVGLVHHLEDPQRMLEVVGAGGKIPIKRALATIVDGDREKSRSYDHARHEQGEAHTRTRDQQNKRAESRGRDRQGERGPMRPHECHEAHSLRSPTPSTRVRGAW